MYPEEDFRRRGAAGEAAGARWDAPGGSSGGGVDASWGAPDRPPTSLMREIVAKMVRVSETLRLAEEELRLGTPGTGGIRVTLEDLDRIVDREESRSRGGAGP